MRKIAELVGIYQLGHVGFLEAFGEQRERNTSPPGAFRIHFAVPNIEPFGGTQGFESLQQRGRVRIGYDLSLQTVRRAIPGTRRICRLA